MRSCPTRTASTALVRLTLTERQAKAQGEAPAAPKAPTFSAGFLAAARRGRRINSRNPFPRSYSAER